MSRIFSRLNGAQQGAATSVLRIGLVDDVLNSLGGMAAIRALFPDMLFESLGAEWPRRPPPYLQVMIVSVAGDNPQSVADALTRLARSSSARVIVALSGADVVTTHRLARGGAADILPIPFTEAALALCLERLVAGGFRGDTRDSSEMIAVMKAGGGVGATTLACQSAAMLSGAPGSKVCLADLDLQFGDAALQLDLPRSVSVADLLTQGNALGDTPFLEVLGAHRSGLRLLAAPDDIMGLETVSPEQIDSLVQGLKRDFHTTLIDLPSVWTSWTSTVLGEADRILLVTSLTVPHVQMAKRQLAALATLDFDDRPIILACNQVSPEQQSSLSQKAAERALGRPIDVLIPEDRKVMTAASNQGVEVRDVQKGGKLHKAVSTLTGLLSASADAPVARRAVG